MDGSYNLHMVLYTGSKTYHALDPQRFYVFFENERDYPLQTFPLILESGVSTRVILQRNTYNQYQKPYSDCVVLEDDTLVEPVPNRTLYDQIVKQSGFAYSRKTCYALCNQNWWSAACVDFEPRPCSIVEYQIYVHAYTVQSVECLQLCPLECRKSFLRRSISLDTIPHDHFVKYQSTFDIASHAGQLNYTDYQFKTFVEFHATYATFSTIEVSEEPRMSGENLLGEIGNHLHLFLGMSLLSFVEIIEFILTTVFVALFTAARTSQPTCQ